MENKNEFYSQEQIQCAKSRVKTLHEIIYPEMKFTVIEEKLNTNYHTFRAWYSGGTNYFDTKISILAELFGTSVDYLIGNTDNLSTK